MIILLIIVCIIAIPLILASFKGNEFKVERQIIINKPKEIVFNFLKHIKNQDLFSVWMTMDPAMKREFTGADGTIGFVSAWDSTHKSVGMGKQTIKGIKEGERLDMEIQFIKPWNNKANAYFITEAETPERSLVKWGFYNNVKYPMKVMGLFMNMEKMIGKDFDKGLSKLKEVLEK